MSETLANTLTLLFQMTLVAGSTKDLGSGLIQKTFSYSPLSALVNIVFNKAGQIVQAVVEKSGTGSGTSSPSRVASSSVASATAKR